MSGLNWQKAVLIRKVKQKPKIGRIDDLSGWEDALGTDSVTAVFSIVK